MLRRSVFATCLPAATRASPTLTSCTAVVANTGTLLRVLALEEAFKLACELAEGALLVPCLALPVILLGVGVDHVLERRELVVFRHSRPELRLEFLLYRLLASVFVRAELRQNSRACALGSLKLR